MYSQFLFNDLFRIISHVTACTTLAEDVDVTLMPEKTSQEKETEVLEKYKVDLYSICNICSVHFNLFHY